jgi:hypothetical protein
LVYCFGFVGDLESWWSVLIWYYVVLLWVVAIGSSYCSGCLEGFGYEWFKLVWISSCSPATLWLFLKGWRRIWFGGFGGYVAWWWFWRFGSDGMVCNTPNFILYYILLIDVI